MISLLALLLTAAPCHTACGMEAGKGISCRELQDLEARFLWAAADVPEWKGRNLCIRLSGWKVKRHRFDRFDRAVCKGGSWFQEWQSGGGACILGFTFVETRTLEVDAAPLQLTSLTHEMVHAIQFSFPGYDGHCAWKVRGLRRLIWLTGAEPEDASADACGFCPAPQ